MMDTCNFCLMDSTAAHLGKTNQGCFYCLSMKKKKDNSNYDLQKLVSEIKLAGKDRKYDCLIGLSGGVDSAFVLHKALECGLNPLTIHVDNGWNSALSQHNIEKLVLGTKVDFLSEILYWPEYRQHLKAMFLSQVIDLELLADNLMNKVIIETAARYGIHYILNGVNTATEGIPLPENWAWNKLDGRNLTDIIKKNSESKIKYIRPISPQKFYFLQKRFKINNIPFLNYLDYEKESALQALQKEYKFIPYTYKHYENVFTRFYQGYILPQKFGVDKRKMHLSALVVSGEIDRTEGINELKQSPYPSDRLLKKDKRFICKKMGFSESEFEEYILSPEVSHRTFATNIPILKKIKEVFGLEVGFNK